MNGYNRAKLGTGGMKFYAAIPFPNRFFCSLPDFGLFCYLHYPESG